MSTERHIRVAKIVHVLTIYDCFHVFRTLNNRFSSINGGFQNALVYLLVVGRGSKSLMGGYNALAG
jgi:hypothetical protein